MSQEREKKNMLKVQKLKKKFRIRFFLMKMLDQFDFGIGQCIVDQHKNESMQVVAVAMYICI